MILLLLRIHCVILVLLLLLVGSSSSLADTLPFNGRFYQLAPTKLNFQQAMNYASNTIYQNMNGTILSLNDFNEYTFIKNNFGTLVTDFWLGAERLDQHGSSWGWINGSSRRQPFYTAVPDRCLEYCANFKGDLNMTNTNLATKNSMLDWYATPASTELSFIIEFGAADSLMVSRQEIGADRLIISNFPLSMSKYLDSNQVSINISHPQLPAIFTCKERNAAPAPTVGLLCNIPPPSTYKGTFTLTVSGGGQTVSTTFRFNPPAIDALRYQPADPNPSQQPAMRVITIIGRGFQYLSPVIDILNFIDGTAYTYTVDPSGTQMLVSINEFNILPLPITLRYNDTTIVYWRPAILDQASQLHYVGVPFSVDLPTAIALSEQYSAINEDGYVALVDSSATASFIGNTLFLGSSSIKSIWQNIKYQQLGLNGGNFIYNDHVINLTPVPQPTTTGNFYYDMVLGKIVGVDPASISQTRPFVVVLGVRTPVVDTSVNQVSIPIDGGSYPIAMLKNYGWASSSTGVIMIRGTLNLTGSLDVPNKKLLINDGNGGYANRTVQVVLPDKRVFPYYIWYDAPIIKTLTRASAASTQITMTGLNFIPLALEIYPKCTIVGSMTTTTMIVCNLDANLAPQRYNLTVKIVAEAGTGNDVTSKPYDLDLRKMALTSVSPRAIPSSGGTITVFGSAFGNNIDVLQVKFVNTTQAPVNCVSFATIDSACVLNIVNAPPEGTYNIAIMRAGDATSTSNTVQFTVKNLVVNNVTQDQSNLQTIQVFGDSLMMYSPSLSVAVGGAPCKPLIFINDTLLTCTIQSSAANGSVVISNQGNLKPFKSTYIFRPVLLSMEPPTFDLMNVWMNAAPSPDGKVFTPLYKVGANHKLFARNQDGLQSNTLLVSYPLPLVFNTTGSNNTVLMVLGNYLYHFDSGNAMLEGLTSDPIPSTVSSATYTTLQFQLPPTVRSGTFSIVSGGQRSKPKTFTAVPRFENSTSPPTNGGLINITGYYMAPYSYINDQVLKITVGGLECTELKVLRQVDSWYQLSCVAPRGTGKSNMIITNNVGDGFGYALDYQSPSVVGVRSTQFNQSGTVTINGANFANTNLNVTIGGKQCINPRSNNDGTEIQCQFSSDVPYPDSNQSLPVTVSVDSLHFTSQSFIYQVPTQCPVCQHGDCNSTLSKCQCQQGWTGITCSVEIQVGQTTDIPNIDSNTTQVVLGSSDHNLHFNISVTELREVTSSNVVVKQVYLKDASWTTQNFGSGHFILNGTFSSDPLLSVVIDMTVFTNASQYDFAGDAFQVLDNSIKYVVRINSWSFGAKTNALQVLFLSQAAASVGNCGNVQKSKVSAAVSNQQSSLRSIEISQGALVLEGYFSDRIIVDDRVSHSQVDVLPDTDEAVQQAVQTYGGDKLNILTCITIPHFEQYAVVDPNFGSLLVAPADGNGECSGNGNNWKIPVIVTCSVVCALLVVVATIFIVKKNAVLKHRMMRTLSMKRFK
ncbi:hypothetical protein SAMD00019534_043020 [Acytostelium subglobosum LB1]|uniref:hypothetical protein n=1 Tax=Acytostelium subglobosum LB1 TaxID=1410327 RepID=UPI000644EAAC|nr:hypothetical protein SAMD00019534_043020 [Acytostelium subglobosum LB1]GAM21127.1 hypothetical protein SAMD00019534_043020 [Acytostelium subglobosum LB1]|eukprot:XP_012756261.1 hypothetical protein SAMD00019534_043020 [Acytostelium subglobosum LB1]